MSAFVSAVADALSMFPEWFLATVSFLLAFLGTFFAGALWGAINASRRSA